jgi:hypothetical protein
MDVFVTMRQSRFLTPLWGYEEKIYFYFDLFCSSLVTRGPKPCEFVWVCVCECFLLCYVVLYFVCASDAPWRRDSRWSVNKGTCQRVLREAFGLYIRIQANYFSSLSPQRTRIKQKIVKSFTVCYFNNPVTLTTLKVAPRWGWHWPPRWIVIIIIFCIWFFSSWNGPWAKSPMNILRLSLPGATVWARPQLKEGISPQTSIPIFLPHASTSSR